MSAEATMPTGQWCPIGSLNLHTYNYERDECIWCGPNRLAWKPGRWVSTGDGRNAWSVDCCCESSPPEFGGNLPDAECPLHGADA